MGSAGRRYAKALFALAKEKGLLKETAEELSRAATIAQNPSVLTALRNPVLSGSQRQSLADMMVSELKLSDLSSRFLHLLAERRRLAELPAMSQRFEDMLDQNLGRVRAKIRSATELDSKQQQEVVTTFTKITGKEIVPEVIVEPELLGGIVVEIDGTVYDGSVKTQFARVAKNLSSAQL